MVRGEHRAHPSVEALLSRQFLGDKVRHRATDQHLEETSSKCSVGNMRITYLGAPDFPQALAADIAPPAVVFWRGDLTALDQRRVGIIGTRAATAAGRFMASQLGFDLARNEVAVVSGLARGIDAWAHRGAVNAITRTEDSPHICARPIAVVASGLDVIYPRENSVLWREIAEHGLLLTESPPGTAPEAFRFPLRNRILAALSEVLIVVESRATGGSMITVEEAQQRDVTVMAVPGSPKISSAAGTNLLLQQGCAPVVDVADVLVALGLDSRRSFLNTYDARRTPNEGDRAVLRAFCNEALTLDHLMVRTGGELVATAIALGRLEADNWVVNNAGWWEAVGPNRG